MRSGKREWVGGVGGQSEMRPHLGLLVVEEDEEAGDGGGGRRRDALHGAAAQAQVRASQRSQQEVLRLQVLHPPQASVPQLDQGARQEMGQQPGETVGRPGGAGGRGPLPPRGGERRARLGISRRGVPRRGVSGKLRRHLERRFGKTLGSPAPL